MSQARESYEAKTKQLTTKDTKVHEGATVRNLRATSFPSWFRNFSAGELIAGKLQAVQVPQGGYRNRFSLEELLRQTLQVFDCDCFNLLDQFVEIVKAVEIHFLARQVRHARRARLERKHQASLELVFRTAKLFGGHRFGLELAEFADHRLHDLYC